jgi:hypothetical protein
LFHCPLLLHLIAFQKIPYLFASFLCKQCMVICLGNLISIYVFFGWHFPQIKGWCLIIFTYIQAINSPLLRFVIISFHSALGIVNNLRNKPFRSLCIGIFFLLFHLICNAFSLFIFFFFGCVFFIFYFT